MIRNFALIAHIDHGKSTLADRLLELTGTISEKKMRAQYLDQLALERERGITIKMAPVRMEWTLRQMGGERGAEKVVLHCIDTPGHVDFTYEVSRALTACEGALLLVDAVQGVQAQTLAHGRLAQRLGLTLLLAINKIDLKEARPEEVALAAQQLFGIPEDRTFFLSAKTGEGVEALLDGLALQIPPPIEAEHAPLQALVFDSHYDAYKGIILSIRLFSGTVKPGDMILLHHAAKRYEVEEVGSFTPYPVPAPRLAAGEVGFLTAQIKSLSDAKVGDTLLSPDSPAEPLHGYAPPKPFVFAGLFPADGESVKKLESALLKLQLEDSSLQFEREKSPSLGLGFRAGFLGPLHIEIVQQRLEREQGIDLIVTSASVPYQVVLKSGETLELRKANDLPLPDQIEKIKEPLLRIQIVTPKAYLGRVMSLTQSARATFCSLEYPSPDQAVLTYTLPLRELLTSFYEELKVASSGFATLDYQFQEYVPGDLVRLDILIAEERIAELSSIVPREQSYKIGKGMVNRLKREIPRHLFEVAIQAAIGGKVVARANVPPLRKNVLAKCYGGDVTRKHKLLEKQKAGKKRLKQVGKVRIPQKAFLSLLKKER